MAAAAFWHVRAPEDVTKKHILYVGDITIIVLSILALGIVGLEAQVNASFFPFYAVMIAFFIRRRHRPGYRAWNALRLCSPMRAPRSSWG